MVVVCVVFHTAILQGMGNWLIREDAPQPCDAMVVLSGNAFDRGNEGARLYAAGYASHIICPGGNIERLFLINGDTVYESELLKRNIVRHGVPDSIVSTLCYGTSTIEEADTIQRYCMAHRLRRILVVTSLFHTRRARAVYIRAFCGTGIQIVMRGAHDSSYDEMHWWQSEYGLLALNNEYMKTIYYALK